jgi:hypothetical protein
MGLVAPEEAGVDDNQQADPKDQPSKQKAQTIEKEIRVEPQQGHPFQLILDHLAAHHGGGVDQKADKRCQRDRSRRPGAGVAPCTDHQTRQQRAQKRKGGDKNQRH